MTEEQAQLAYCLRRLEEMEQRVEDLLEVIHRQANHVNTLWLEREGRKLRKAKVSE